MAVTGWKTPGTCISADEPPAGIEWTNPSNAKVSDDAYAQSIIPRLSATRYLECTDFGFTADDIPSDNVVDGIEVKVERKANLASYIYTKCVFLRNSSGYLTGCAGGAYPPYFPTTDTERTFGASDDNWGVELTGADIQDNTFGVGFQAENLATMFSVYAYIDCISIRVHHSPPPPGGASYGYITG